MNKSGVVTVDKKKFRYDYENHVVEYVFKPTKKQIAENEAEKMESGYDFLKVDEKGYSVITTIGLREENWKNKGVREEYLAEWSAELDEEHERMIYDFEVENGLR